MISFVSSYSVPVTICPLASINAETTKDRLDRVDQLRIANLTRNEPGTFSLNYKSLPLPSKSWKEKIFLLNEYFSRNLDLHKKSGKALLKFIAVFSLVLAVGAIVHPILNRFLANLKQDILLGRLQYTKPPYDRVGMDYYYLVKASYFVVLSAFACMGLAVPAIDLYCNANGLTRSLLEFYKDPTRLICEVALSEEKSSIENFSNEKLNGKVVDPISSGEIKEEWINAPRFIKIGTYVYSLDTLIRRFFTRSLGENKQIQNPLGNWSITPEQQEKLRKDLCDLLFLDPKDLEKYWDPYFCDLRKPYRTLGNHPRLVAAVTEEERRAVMQDILFEEDLSSMVPNWNDYNPSQQASIKRQIAPDYFADCRIIRFLSEFDKEVLAFDIKLNDTESFKLQDLLNESKNRSYNFEI